MNYSKDKNTYFEVPKKNQKDLVQKEIGDSKQADFYPQQKISRWNNECNVSIRLIHDEKNPKVSLVGDVLSWKGDKIDALFYDIPDGEGASEFEIVLKEKPESNVIMFTVVDKDVEYFYQSPLTEKEISQGSSRPENVDGSYAIYSKTVKKNIVGGKEYKTGKVGHIYRPKIIDSNGSETWGDLLIKDGILSVTIPQSFLDDAVYPVRHAAGLTFGYTTIGGTSNRFYNIDEITIFIATFAGSSPASDGVLTSISMYGNHTTTTVNAQFGMFNASTLALVGNTPTNTFSSSPQWNTFNVSGTPSVLSSQSYLFGLMYQGTTQQMNIYYDSLFMTPQAGNGGYYRDTVDTVYGTWPSTVTLSSGPNSTNFGNSIYATYTPSSSGPANLKTYNTNVKSNIKSIDTNLLANIKTLDTNI